jgi:hypothetical protein
MLGGKHAGSAVCVEGQNLEPGTASWTFGVLQQAQIRRSECWIKSWQCAASWALGLLQQADDRNNDSS